MKKHNPNHKPLLFWVKAGPTGNFDTTYFRRLADNLGAKLIETNPYNLPMWGDSCPESTIVVDGHSFDSRPYSLFDSLLRSPSTSGILSGVPFSTETSYGLLKMALTNVNFEGFPEVIIPGLIKDRMGEGSPKIVYFDGKNDLAFRLDVNLILRGYGYDLICPYRNGPNPFSPEETGELIRKLGEPEDERMVAALKEESERRRYLEELRRDCERMGRTMGR